MESRLARWLLPSATHWLWLLLALMLLGQPWRTTMVASDGDTCMHWRVGEWMLQHREIIRADEFSHTRPGARIISKEWLSEIIFATAGRAAGMPGLAVVAALLIASTFALLHRQLLREDNDLLAATLVFLIAVWAACVHWMARPHAFSFLMILFWNDALRRFRRDRQPVRLALRLVGLTVLWVNLHGAFLAGFIVLGCYWLGAAFERDRRALKLLTGVALLCAVASLANPSGYRLHLHNIAFLRSTFFTNWLAEYASPDFQSPDMRGFLAWLALMFFTLALCRPKLCPADGVLLIVWTYFSLRSGRNIPLLVILAAPVLAPALSEAMRRRWARLARRFHAANAGCRGWPVAASIAVAVIVFVPRPIEMPAKDWPVEAVRLIEQNPERVPGKMFNQYAWGGYLMQVLPDRPVFVDGRADFYGEPLAREFDDVTALRTNWLAVLDRHDVDWTLMPTDHKLNRALKLLPEWSCVHSDTVATIFRRSP